MTEEKIKYFEDLQRKIVDMEREYKNEFAKYCAELKAEVGITDGEQLNVLQLVKTIKAIVKQ